jgi:hypothetical protein
MASPEALLLRHRVHTTNICKKVIRSLLRRLFKIGHLGIYFGVYFYKGVTVPKWNSLRGPLKQRTTWQLP